MSALAKMRVALIQVAPVWHDPAANRKLFEEMIGTLDQDVDLVVLPEMFSTGFTMSSSEMAETMAGETVTWLRDQATQHDLTIVGSVIIEDGPYFNRLVWMPPGGQMTTYDKRHLFRMAGEHEHYAAGSNRVVANIGPWRVCLSVCYDLRFPVWLRCRNDYDLLLCVANWPATRQTAWNALLRARAVENQCYVVAVNRIGTDGNGIEYRGGSAVYDWNGTDLTRGDSAERPENPAILYASLDLEAVRAHRQSFPAWRDADEFRVVS